VDNQKTVRDYLINLKCLCFGPLKRPNENNADLQRM
jgi:hypothetical protein